MSTLISSARRATRLAELENGDRMTREAFHRAYERAPRQFRAELIGGIVHLPSPLRRLHGQLHLRLGTLLWIYEGNTPGVEAGDNTTVLLGDKSEVQPDLYLRILSEYGGASTTDRNDYVVGPPELIIEVAHSSKAIDLHEKLDAYKANGVREYLVAAVADRRMHWFDLSQGQELVPDADGILRARYFPGLWMHLESLFDFKSQGLLDVLSKGLASPEHAEFISRLETEKHSRSAKPT
jgi:Uma2 family endonuclease